MATSPEILPERIAADEGLSLRRWTVADIEALGQAVTQAADHLRPWMSWMAEMP